jgi:hypothetical protein
MMLGLQWHIPTIFLAGAIPGAHHLIGHLSWYRS